MPGRRPASTVALATFTRTSASKRVNNILETIGNTPHVRLNRLYSEFPGNEVWLKLERANPGGSIKDRIGIAMIDDAERRGALKKGGTIIEPTSGNTGSALAMARSEEHTSELQSQSKIVCRLLRVKKNTGGK